MSTGWKYLLLQFGNLEVPKLWLVMKMHSFWPMKERFLMSQFFSTFYLWPSELCKRGDVGLQTEETCRGYVQHWLHILHISRRGDLNVSKDFWIGFYLWLQSGLITWNFVPWVPAARRIEIFCIWQLWFIKNILKQEHITIHLLDMISSVTKETSGTIWNASNVLGISKER